MPGIPPEEIGSNANFAKIFNPYLAHIKASQVQRGSGERLKIKILMQKYLHALGIWVRIYT